MFKPPAWGQDLRNDSETAFPDGEETLTDLSPSCEGLHPSFPVLFP